MKSIKKLAEEYDVSYERGRDSDGYYIRLGGFLCDLQSLARKVQDRYWTIQGDDGLYLRKRSN